MIINEMDITCIVWIVLYGIASEIGEKYTVQPVLLGVYVLGLIVFLNKRGKLGCYGVAFPKKVPGIYATCILALFSVIAMNCIISDKAGLMPELERACIVMLFSVFVEELFFRGYLLRKFNSGYGEKCRWKGIVISGVVFSFMHLVNLKNGADFVYTLFQMFCSFELAICLGIVAQIYDSILVGAVIHYLINLSSIGVYEVTKERYCMYVLLLMLCVIYTCFMYRQKYNEGEKKRL